MDIRFAIGPAETQKLTTDELRSHFLIEQLIVDDTIQLVYTHYDRMIVGGVKPVVQQVKLHNHPELRADYFLERREMGIINVGGEGIVVADENVYSLAALSCLYLGKGTKDIVFKSLDKANPAVFYLLSVPAHKEYPAALLSKEQATPVQLGSNDSSNLRTIYKYIHLQGIQSCQLVMGLTVLEKGSVWNSFPPHTHSRRMEAYFYFDVTNENRVFHFLGEPQETRHIVLSNHQAVLSPPWSTHYGCGTSNYGFIWGMAGENLRYDDMDSTPVNEIK